MSREVPVSNQALKNALDCTTQLFPDPDNKLSSLTLDDRLLGTMSFTAATAFTADKTPETAAGMSKTSSENAIGVQEHTIDGTTVTHVHKTKIGALLDCVLDIELKSLTNVIDKDGGFGSNLLRPTQRGESDPFVVFTRGVSMATSKILENRTSINYGSDHHYLFLRKKDKTMVKEEHDQLNVFVFDRDDGRVNEGSSLKTIKSLSQLLGSATCDIKELKKNQGETIWLQLSGGYRPMTVVFSCRFMSFDEYCKEQGKDDDSKWLNHVTFDQDSDQMFKEMKSVKIEASDPPMPLLHLYNKNTSTQGWIHMCATQKVLMVSFKGTGVEDNFKDFITDVNMVKVPLEGTDIDEYKFDSSESLADKSGNVHKGFREAYVSIRDIMLETLYTVSLWRSNWLIVFTGHSLGGALATLAAYEVSNRKLKGHRPNVAMINFGCPRLASDEFRTNYNQSVEVSYRFRAPRDIVPCVPPGFGHVGREVQQGADGVFLVKDLSYDGQTFAGYVGGAVRAVLDPLGIAAKIAESIQYHLRGNYFDTITHAGAKIRALTKK